MTEASAVASEGMVGAKRATTMFLSVLALLLTGPAAAGDLPGYSLRDARDGERPQAVAETKEARAQAPNFGFFALRTKEVVVLREDADLEWRIQADAAAFGAPLGVRRLAGGPVLVYIWGPPTVGPKPFCPACPAAMDLAQRLHDRFSLSGLRVAGLAVETPNGLLAESSQRYSHLLGRDTRNAAGALGIQDVLGWALLDAKGRLVVSTNKPMDEAYLAGKVEELLRE